MRKFINYFIYSIVVIPLIIFLLVLVLYGAYNLNRSYKIATIRYFIGESTSPNTQSTLKIYQKGGDSIVSLQTPLEFECTNQYGTIGFIKDIKNGTHLPKLRS